MSVYITDIDVCFSLLTRHHYVLSIKMICIFKWISIDQKSNFLRSKYGLNEAKDYEIR